MQKNLALFLAMSDLLCPDLRIGEGHYEMMGGVCLSVRLSVACLDITRE